MAIAAHVSALANQLIDAGKIEGEAEQEVRDALNEIDQERDGADEQS